MNRFFRSALFPLVVIVLLVYLASQTLIPHKSSTANLTYGQAVTRIENNELKPYKVTFEPSGHQTGTIVIQEQASGGQTDKINYASDNAQLQFQNLLQKKGIDYDSKSLGGSPWWGS